MARRPRLIGVGAILPLGALLAGRHLREIDRKADVPVVEIGLLRSLELFAPLRRTDARERRSESVPVEVVAGTAVVVQGDAGDRWYAIADGTVEVVVTGGTLPSSVGVSPLARLR